MAGSVFPAWLAPLLLPSELGASDRYAIDDCGIPGIDLMERAGGALARAVGRCGLAAAGEPADRAFFGLEQGMAG